MSEGVSPVGRPLGRTDLLTSVGQRLAAGSSVLLAGVAGIGKSTVLAAAVGQVVGTGARVLRCAPARADAGLSFLALADLLEPVPAELFDRLPAVPRRALSAALQRGQAPAAQPEPLAVRLAVRQVLRELAASGPVVLAIDDLQWVDQDSAQVLAYAFGRLGGSGLRVLATERVEAGRPRLRSLLPTGAVELAVGPLDEEALVTLLRQRSGELVRRPLALEIHRATDGNPLFALEIADALVRQGRPLA
ncbi:MAG TPA: AAA family ATPase, partial [Streptosporangiaceae bacterium]